MLLKVSVAMLFVSFPKSGPNTNIVPCFSIPPGPYKVNGVPLRRVNQAYVIATSTTVDISKVSIPANVNDAYFKRVVAAKTGSEEEMFGVVKAVEIPAQRKADQKSVDAALLTAIEAVPSLKHYLNAKFSLSKGDKPHAMKF